MGHISGRTAVQHRRGHISNTMQCGVRQCGSPLAVFYIGVRGLHTGRTGICVRMDFRGFYAYGGILGSWDPEWLQVALNILIGLFRHIGLVANFKKLNTIMFQTVGIILGISEEALSQRSTGKRSNYRYWLRRKIICPECGMVMTAGSMIYHLRWIHGTDL